MKEPMYSLISWIAAGDLIEADLRAQGVPPARAKELADEADLASCGHKPILLKTLNLFIVMYLGDLFLGRPEDVDL